MSHIIGIDLGTTNCVVSRFDENGRPVIVFNEDGDNTTPSVIEFKDTNTYEVGKYAYNNFGQKDIYPNVFGRFKRHMGTDKTYGGDGSLSITHTPETLSALLLKKLKEDAEKALNGSIAEAVVTIPANFTNTARESTLAAAKSAGLNVNYIINEPTAAAFYYAAHLERSLNGTYVVYDLGGGTFDVSVIKVSGKEVEVLATEGVQKLGGDDFDKALQTLVKDKYKTKTGGYPDESDYTIVDAEENKKALSKSGSIKISLNSTGGKAIIDVSQQEFLESISSLMAQTEMLCESVLEQANKTINQIDDIFLVGGSTRMPCVTDSIKRIFKKDPVCFVNPDEVVALGASLYAAYKSDVHNLNALQRKAVAEVNTVDITGKFFGTIILADRKTKKRENSIIIEKGTTIPCVKEEIYYTVYDGQIAVDCSVTECNMPDKDLKYVEVVWQGSLSLPPGRPAGQEILVEYSYDANQIMHCCFTDVETGKRTEIDLTMSKSKDNDDLDIGDFWDD